MTARLAETTDPETPGAPLPAPAVAPGTGTDASPGEPAPGGPEDGPEDGPDAPDEDDDDGDDGPDGDEPGEGEPETGDAVAARLSADADRWTADAMAAPLGDPLSGDDARALVSAPLGGAVLGGAWAAYEACDTVTEAGCDAMTGQWEREARESLAGHVAEWKHLGRPACCAEAGGDAAPEEADADWAAARARVLGPLDEARRVLHAA